MIAPYFTVQIWNLNTDFGINFLKKINTNKKFLTG